MKLALKKLRTAVQCFFCVLALMLVALPARAAGPEISKIRVVSTIATLRAIPVVAAAQYPNVRVTDYYGTGTNCPIEYVFNASDVRTDDGGAIINPTGNAGNGRWDLNLPSGSPLHTCVYGVKVDSPASAGTGTDNTTQLQAALNWAFNYGPNRVHLDSLQGYCIMVASVITPNQGEIIEGDGNGQSINSVNTGSCLSYTGIPGGSGAYVLTTQSVLTGIGTTGFASPKFRDFTIYYFSIDTNPGGCIQLNSIAGGFTDTTSSQQPMIDPEIRNIFCSLRAINNSAKIGFQISKARDGVLDGDTVFGGNNGFDIEGSENIRLQGCAISATYGEDIRIAEQNTFSQVNLVQNCQLLGPVNYGQTVDSMLYDSARESVIQNNFFENFTTSLNSIIHLQNGINAGVYSNAIGANATNWLLVDGIWNTITATGNAALGVYLTTAKFNNGNYFFSGSSTSTLSHYGNGNGDQGWPFNSKNGLEQNFAPKVEAIYSPDYNGLTPNGYGLSEIPVNSTFNMPVSGSSSSGDLEFTFNRLPAPTGTFDVSIHAWMASGTGNIVCQLEDNGALVGSPITQAITATPTWYTLAFAQAISTSAGLRCWNTTSGQVAYFNLAQIQDH
jgi:hypothetical protein